jgi:hypothetical protein|tara:strand:- start:379 stop:1098 length:720 start_codon:yes stop_codon:yes gene_type:complete
MTGKGLVLRDYEAHPEFSGYAQCDSRYPRSEWPSRLEYLNENRAQPLHWHQSFCKIPNQRSTSLCWMYNLVQGVENRLAASGTPVQLNAYATAYKYRGTDRKGGFGLEAAKVINDIGCPRKAVIPEFRKTRRWDADVTKDAQRHKIADFYEIAKNDLDGAISALLDGFPCTFAIRSWNHLVLGVGLVRGRRDWGVVFANSWGTRYTRGGMGNGYGILWGKDAVPFESIVVKHAKARGEQ